MTYGGYDPSDDVIDEFTVNWPKAKGLRDLRRGSKCELALISENAFCASDPTSERLAQHLVEAFADREAPRYLIRDRDGVYGDEVCARLRSLRIEEVLTAPQSPWQNAYAERLIGPIRRECLNHFIILYARHLKRTLAAYFHYYHRRRTHLVLEEQCPIERQIMRHGTIVEIAELGGLHHRYEPIAA